jgi:vanillate O-demethylase ferredoxin subunit
VSQNTLCLRLRVAHIRQETDNVRSYELVAQGGEPLPPFEPGAHLEVTVPGGPVRCYSLCSSPAERHRYLIAVQREEAGRGGSRAMHERVREGDILTVGVPRNGFALQPAPHTVLIAGGIGLTPLLSMAHALLARGASFELHVCTRSSGRTAFRQVLSSPGLASRVRFHHSEDGQRLDVRALLAAHPAGAHLYCCGPQRLMSAVREAAAAGGWPEEAVHFESFCSSEQTPSGPSFQLSLRRSGLVLPVPAGKSILSVLRERGVEVSTSCEAGVCGACVTPVLGGEPEHRDQVLSPEERAGGKCIAICVSRARSDRLELDL